MSINNLENLFKSFFNRIEDNESLSDYIKEKIQEFYLHNSLRNKIADYDWVKVVMNQLRNENTISSNSIMDFIQEKIDLKDFIGMDNNEPKLKRLLDNQFWNESVFTLIRDWIEHFRPQFALNHITDNHLEYIKKADALYSFDTIDVVLPKKNANNDIFYDFIKEGEDINIQYNVIFDLENDKHINNTNQSYLNLAMPKNSRRINLMDLNRNFWVVSQNISYLLKYLFSPESNFTFSNMINKIAKELFELWENMIYLWAALYVIYEYDEHPLHLEIIPLPNDKYCTSRKFDNFEYTSLHIQYTDSIIERINFMKKRYPRHNLCIIPIIRTNNYEYNYYSNEYYPGLFIKAYNENNFHYVKFNGSQNGSFYMGTTIDKNQNKKGEILLDGTAYTLRNFINDKSNCSYVQPFSRVNEMGDLVSRTYTSVFRTKPEINYRYENGRLVITNLYFNYVDAVKVSLDGYEEIYGRFYNIEKYTYDFNSNNNNSIINFSFIKFKPNFTNNQKMLKKKGDITENFYRGECLSGDSVVDSQDFLFDTEVIDLIPSYESYNIIREESPNSEISDEKLYKSNRIEEIIKNYEETYWKYLTADDEEIVEMYSRKKSESENDIDYSMKMIIGNHALALWGENEGDYKYWIKDDDNIKEHTQKLPSEHAYHLLNGAALYNPATAKITSYSKYLFYSNYAPGGNWTTIKQDGANMPISRTWTGYTDSYAYLYVKKGEPLLDNNWALRYVETTGTLSYENNLLPLPSLFKEHEWNKLFDTCRQIDLDISWDVWGIPDNKLVKENFSYQHKVLKHHMIYYGVDWYDNVPCYISDVMKIKEKAQNNRAECFRKAIEERNKVLKEHAIFDMKSGNNFIWEQYLDKTIIKNPYSGEEMEFYKLKNNYREKLQNIFYDNEELTSTNTIANTTYAGRIKNPLQAYFTNYKSWFLMSDKKIEKNDMIYPILVTIFGCDIFMSGKAVNYSNIWTAVSTKVGTAPTYYGVYRKDHSSQGYYSLFAWELVDGNYKLETTREGEYGNLLDSVSKIRRIIDEYCEDLIKACDKWIQWYYDKHKEDIEHFIPHDTETPTVKASPIYSKIKTHLFFSNGDYYCKEYIQCNGNRDKWNYYIVYDNDREKDSQEYDSKRALLSDDKKNLFGDYILYKDNATRERVVNGKTKTEKLDYEKYPITGFPVIFPSIAANKDVNEQIEKVKMNLKESS